MDQEPPYVGGSSFAERRLALTRVIGECGQPAAQRLERCPGAVRVDELLGDLHGDRRLGRDPGGELGRRDRPGRRPGPPRRRGPRRRPGRRRWASRSGSCCLARAGPTTAARRVVMPQPGTVAIPTSGAPTVTWSAAIRRSQARASSSPPPNAMPFSAAMVGCRRASSRSRTRCPVRVQVRHMSSGERAGPGDDVGAGRERLRPGAGDDHHPDVGVGLDRVERGIEVRQHRQRQGVELLGPVQA